MTFPTRALRLLIAAVTGGLLATAGCNARESSEKLFRVPEGLTIRVRGRGPDVILVHGALGDYRQWEPIGIVLSRGYRVIAVSRRFHWPNPPPSGTVQYSFEKQSTDLDELLRSLHRPVHLVGHSYGAGVALLTVLHHPELVRSLTLIEPPFGSVVPPWDSGFAAELASRDSMVAALRVDVQAGSVDRAAEVLMDWVEGVPDGFRRLPQAAQDELLKNAATVGPTYAVPAPRVTCRQLRRLRLPVLVLRGEQTRPWYRLIAQATANCIRGAEAAVVPAARHMTIVQNPSGTAGLVLSFIMRH
jgi:pimeloyl-ACP methyl ester carboxylesterase